MPKPAPLDYQRVAPGPPRKTGELWLGIALWIVFGTLLAVWVIAVVLDGRDGKL